jgi:hypothetical protein
MPGYTTNNDEYFSGSSNAQSDLKKSSKKHQGLDQHWHHFNDAIQFYESLQLKSSFIKTITINIQSEQGSFSRTIYF